MELHQWKFIINQVEQAALVLVMMRLQVEDRATAIPWIRIEGNSNSDNNQDMLINTQRITLTCSDNQKLMKLSIKKLLRQIKVRLVLEGTNMIIIKILTVELKAAQNILMLNRTFPPSFNLVDQLDKSKLNKLLLTWENNICKTDSNKKNHQLSHGQAKEEVVDKSKAENKDGTTKIAKLTNNTKENLNIKTNGKEEAKDKKIQDIKENLKTKLKTSTLETLNTPSKKTKVHNIQGKRSTNRSRAINTRGSHNTKSKRTSIKENLSIKNRKTNTKEDLNNNSKNQIIIRNHFNKTEDQWLVQAPSPLSNTLVTHQVENHKLHSDILRMNFYFDK